MAPQQTPSQAQIEAQKAAIIAADLAKRRAHKPTDKNIPDGIEEHIIGDGVQQYKRLREVERKLDAVMMRKRIDIQDSVQHGSKRHRTLRIWISNTVDNQPWQGRGLDADMFDFHTGVEATYRVKIEGRLLEDDFQDEPSDKADNDEDMDKQEDSEKPSGSTDEGSGPSKESERPSHPHSKTKLSHFFKSIIVDFDRAKNLQPDAMTSIEWKKPPLEQGTTILPATADFDCLEFERKSDENINCTINFYRDETPERYLLSKELEDVLDTEEDDRTSIILGLWEYIKALNLQQDEEKRLIQCDDRLRAVSPSQNPHLPPPTSPFLSKANPPNPALQIRHLLLPRNPHPNPITPHPPPTPLPPLHHPRRPQLPRARDPAAAAAHNIRRPRVHAVADPRAQSGDHAQPGNRHDAATARGRGRAPRGPRPGHGQLQGQARLHDGDEPRPGRLHPPVDGEPEARPGNHAGRGGQRGGRRGRGVAARRQGRRVGHPEREGERWADGAESGEVRGYVLACLLACLPAFFLLREREKEERGEKGACKCIRSQHAVRYLW